MVMSEKGGLAMHQLSMRHRGLVQPSLVMNPHPIHESCSIEASQNKKSQRLSQCMGCGGQIHDQYILRVAPDLEWHAACLRCQECQQFLDEKCTCFVRDGKTYCKRDYVRVISELICMVASRIRYYLNWNRDEKKNIQFLSSTKMRKSHSLCNKYEFFHLQEWKKLFGAKCDKCGNIFSKSDYVMRAKNKIYHIECFRCCACARPLVPGDEFALRNSGDLYCKEDHDVLENKSGLALATPHGVPTESNNNTNISNNNHSNTSNDLGCMSDSGSESGSHKGGSVNSGGGTPRKSGVGGGGGSDGKPTRVRTVLNEKQLHTLRTCYSANPRPDALMKEQLVEMTGLSPRVIRVWFQNKRCKDKKKTLLMKQQMQHEKDGRKLGYGAMQGIPMVASSPVRHDSPLGIHPLEVQAYQPPWKALSDFAMHSDLDQPHQPAFQQLMNQMHGYDLPPPSMGSGATPGTTPGLLANSAPPPDSMTHPDSTDSYVTYLESDDSLTASP